MSVTSSDTGLPTPLSAVQVYLGIQVEYSTVQVYLRIQVGMNIVMQMYCIG